MTEIRDATIHAFYLFDVAQEIRLDVIRAALGSRVLDSRTRAPGMPSGGYASPPVAVNGLDAGLAAFGDWTVETRFYDYGVVSLRFSKPFAGAWADLGRLGSEFIENEELEREATRACRALVDRFGEALIDGRRTFLDEDYLALVVSAADASADAEALVRDHGADIAQFLRGETQPLSGQERDEVLRHRLSYLRDDLVIPTWNAAFIYDSAAGARPTLEILEFVNSQLLEFRYHDELLETELAQTYPALQQPHRLQRIIGRRYARAARRLHALFIDVNELTDRVENAMKVAGDLYAARLITLTGSRVGLDAWKHNVQDKLKTLDDIYRFAVEQTGISQANLLEFVIVLILVIELGLLLAGLTR